MMTIGAAERDRLNRLYNDPSVSNFARLVDSWAECIQRHGIDVIIAQDALRLACYFSGNPKVWKERRRLNVQ